ncbi:chloramphenicol O-acetyltransferase type A [Flavobacterium arsenatis]|uniref:Chloramphenicol O-acetyltransferase type A n=1 Tax=Flavobacterium arsenatis TaxID=1484332 RepID=A0ABU1TLG9_9FLAO|nr:chloramphenicol acetyltransferase [Flavobacterium arsenatis]MDR6966823.1 chloramphenicol O-acetyltransferase type A [Flavobacterium arsenatis]
MKTLLDIANWPRKEHFDFFRKFEEPFFGATVQIDCTKAYQTAKSLNASFFIYYLHKTLVAINSIECFRYRIEKDKIFVYDKVNASATISREDGSFGFSLVEYNPDFQIFNTIALTEIERVRNTTGLFTRTFNDDNLIHFSAIPWLNFTSLSHARSFTFPDSCPKISFGKMMVHENGKRTMAMSIHVHHGLMDGFHLGQFVDVFQELMNS